LLQVTNAFQSGELQGMGLVVERYILLLTLLYGYTQEPNGHAETSW